MCAERKREAQPVGFITGASGGIGAATAKLLLDRGHRLYCSSRDAARLTSLAMRGATALELDLTDSTSIRQCADVLLEREDRLDYLVNNAGAGCYGILEAAPLSLARRQFDVNFFGPLHLTQLLLPLLRRAVHGRVVAVSSAASSVPLPAAGLYCASKAAGEAAMEVLRLELEATCNVSVIVVVPRAVKTMFGQHALASLDAHPGGELYRDVYRAAHEVVRRRLILGDGALPPGDVADAIVAAILSSRPRRFYYVPRVSATRMPFARPFFIRRLRRMLKNW